MWEFVRILLFSAIVSITGGKRDFPPGRYQFDLDEPLVAINEGASIYVDVSSMLPPRQSLASKRKWADHFPIDSMTVHLIPDENSSEPVQFSYQGNISYTSDSVYLILSSDKAVPQGVDYVAAEFTTTVDLNHTELLWKNHGK